jgi:hypothetical protein
MKELEDYLLESFNVSLSIPEIITFISTIFGIVLLTSIVFPAYLRILKRFIEGTKQQESLNFFFGVNEAIKSLGHVDK